VRIELTVAACDRHQDVVVEAPDSAAVASVLPQLAELVGANDDAQLWRGDEPVVPTTPLADAGLRAGSLLTFGRGRHRRSAPAVLSLHVVSGPAAGLIVPLERGRLRIGRADDSDLVLADADASRRHAVIDVTTTTIRLRDLGSTNGTRVDGYVVPSDGLALRVGCLISIGDSLLTPAGPVDAPAAVQPTGDGTVIVLRPPRRQHLVSAREITLPTRSPSTRPRGVQWITALLPAVGGGAVAWFSHSPEFLLFALLSPLMMVSTALGDRIHWRRSRRRDAATYRRRRAEADRQIADGLTTEAAVRRAAAPDPAAMMRQVTLPGSRLWERRRADPDLLQVRIGTTDLPSTLATREAAALAPAGTLQAVPLCVDLRRGPLGVAGPPDVIPALARWVVGQLAALHSPGDVEFAMLLADERSDQWMWARWLPHLRGRVATTDDEWSELVTELTSVVDQRLDGRRFDPDGWRGPWLVVVIDRAGRLSEVAGLAALLARGIAVGITAVCVDVDAGALPTSCAAVAQVHGVTGSRLVLRRTTEASESMAVIDQVSPAWADELARSLAPLVDAGASGSDAVPDDCQLLDMLGPGGLELHAVEQRWAASSGGARSALGRSADGVLEVDLATDGPHALIAGTTGAGKSELLQTLVATLAANHPPEDLNFQLVDYKGGAAFAECARLPHTAGLVTDLDPYLTERALRALNSELRRRERLFAEAGANDLTAYRSSGGREPVARLVIVVDEFAALAEELPDFVRGLVGVAQRGRSLGVHLVLATQRPGSAVSAEIRANTALRIALRVTDPGESSDVIDSPAAASIERSHPGRAYLRTGATLTCFQAGHPSGTGRSDPTRVSVEALGPWRRRLSRTRDHDRGTDLARLVDALNRAAQQGGRSSARRPWLAPLPDSLPRADLDQAPMATSISIGRVDLPDEQRCVTLGFDVGAGSSLLITGTTRSGRTGALVSLALGAAAQLDPSRLQLHVVDSTGALAAALKPLPHCATVLGPDDLALTPRLLRRLEREATRRVSERADRGSPDPWPSLVLLVDGWDTLCAALPDLDAAGGADALNGVLRVGLAAGISVALSGDRSTLAPRFSGGFAERVLLRLPDRADYGMAGIAPRDVPARMPPGRGLRAADAAVVQIAHAGARPDPDEMRRNVDAVARQWSSAHCRLGADAIRIRPLPSRVGLAELPTTAGRLSIGLAGDRLDLMALDLFAGSARMLVAGPPRSGRTTVLRLLATQAHAAGIATVVAATSRSALAADARRLAIPVLGPADRDVGTVPQQRTLLLVDDSEAFVEGSAGDRLTSWVRACDAPLAVVVAGRADDLATNYRGLAAEVRRSQCGILLRPGPVDGELLGVRLPRRPSSGPPGRGIAVGDPSWGPPFEDGEPVPIQVATP
jgi:S-DNA-T family DNA segregation ATPase FtsK/SpoIIIE